MPSVLRKFFPERTQHRTTSPKPDFGYSAALNRTYGLFNLMQPMDGYDPNVGKIDQENCEILMFLQNIDARELGYPEHSEDISWFPRIEGNAMRVIYNGAITDHLIKYHPFVRSLITEEGGEIIEVPEVLRDIYAKKSGFMVRKQGVYVEDEGLWKHPKTQRARDTVQTFQDLWHDYEQQISSFEKLPLAISVKPFAFEAA